MMRQFAWHSALLIKQLPFSLSGAMARAESGVHFSLPLFSSILLLLLIRCIVTEISAIFSGSRQVVEKQRRTWAWRPFLWVSVVCVRIYREKVILRVRVSEYSHVIRFVYLQFNNF